MFMMCANTCFKMNCVLKAMFYDNPGLKNHVVLHTSLKLKGCIDLSF